MPKCLQVSLWLENIIANKHFRKQYIKYQLSILYVYDVYRSYCFTHFYRHKIIMYTVLGPNFYISGVATYRVSHYILQK